MIPGVYEDASDRDTIDIDDPASELPPTDQSWAAYERDGVVVSICPEIGPDGTACIQPVYERVEALACETAATALVSILDTENVVQEPVFDRIRRAADAAGDCGLDRWAIVAESSAQYALVDTLVTRGLELYTTEHREDALAWAGGMAPPGTGSNRWKAPGLPTVVDGPRDAPGDRR